MRASARLNILVACLLLSSGCVSQPEAGELYQQGVRALRDGNGVRALELARRAEKRCGPKAECRWRAHLLQAEVFLRSDQVKQAAAALQMEIPDKPEFAPLIARRTWLLGDVEFAQGHFDRSEQLLTRAIQLSDSARADDVGFNARLSQARLVFLLRHDREQAEAIFQSVAEEAARRQDAYDEAMALNGMGMIRLRESRYDEAIPWFRRTIAAAQQGGVQRLIAAGAQNLAICYSQLGDYEAAIDARQRAMRLLGEEGLPPYRMNLAWETGNTYLEQGNPDKAIESYWKALPLAVIPADKAKIYRSLASAYIEKQDWGHAEDSNRTAVSYADDEDSRPWSDRNAAAIEAGRGRYQKACELYLRTIQDAQKTPIVLWESYAALGRLYTLLKDYVRANTAFEKAIDVVDRNADRISVPDYRFTFFSRLIECYQHYVESLVQQRQYDRALEIADSSRARILLERLALHPHTEKPAARDYRSIARRSNSVLLFYWVAPEQSYLWVVTPDRVHPPYRLPSADVIERRVNQYRAFIEQRLGDPMAIESQAGRRLYESLIAPAAKWIPHNSRVILFPDGALNWLSFDTLPVYDKAGQGKPHYWIEDVRPVLGPSLAVLSAESSDRRIPQPVRSLLVIGDPVSPDPEFPKLGFAAKEIHAVEAQFPLAEKRTITGAAASPEAYRNARPGSFSLVHFSAHAVANRESPLDSAIILSGPRDRYKLYARDIRDIALQAKLVTVSACRSAGARAYLGEGLVGFTWAFLQAGARNVIAGLWDVTDRSTPAIMKTLYARVASGASPADALREAKLEMIHSTSFRRPYYWGPFETYTRDVQQFAAKYAPCGVRAQCASSWDLPVASHR
jgi:CHAT domain-containing protein